MPLAGRERLAGDMWGKPSRTYAEFFLDEIVAWDRIALEPYEWFQKFAHGGPFVVCGLDLATGRSCPRRVASACR